LALVARLNYFGNLIEVGADILQSGEELFLFPRGPPLLALRRLPLACAKEKEKNVEEKIRS
jgi:hypothetical protein